MPSCSVEGCHRRPDAVNINNRRKLYALPQGNEELKQKWLQMIGRLKSDSVHHIHVCAEHFAKIDVLELRNKSGNLVEGLKPEAFPTQNLPEQENPVPVETASNSSEGSSSGNTVDRIQIVTSEESKTTIIPCAPVFIQDAVNDQVSSVSATQVGQGPRKVFLIKDGTYWCEDATDPSLDLEVTSECVYSEELVVTTADIEQASFFRDESAASSINLNGAVLEAAGCSTDRLVTAAKAVNKDHSYHCLRIDEEPSYEPPDGLVDLEEAIPLNQETIFDHHELDSDSSAEEAGKDEEYSSTDESLFDAGAMESSEDSDYAPSGTEITDHSEDDLSSGEDEDREEEKPVVKQRCSLCKKKVRNLDSHRKVVHSDERNYVCEHCGSAFKCSSSLAAHQKTIHSDERPYQCEQCDKTFKLSSSLKSHMTIHEGKTVCTVCGMLVSQTALKGHLRRHEGKIKLRKCELCGKRFENNHSLQRHMLTHTKELLYVCEECGKGFSQVCNLKTHMRTHTGEKPHICEVCGLGFSHFVSLKAHHASKHKELASDAPKKKRRRSKKPGENASSSQNNVSLDESAPIEETVSPESGNQNDEEITSANGQQEEPPLNEEEPVPNEQPRTIIVMKTRSGKLKQPEAPRVPEVNEEGKKRRRFELTPEIVLKKRKPGRPRKDSGEVELKVEIAREDESYTTDI